MIVSLHVATGAALGAFTRSHAAALAFGPVLHLAGDRVPHDDIWPRSFEIASGSACLVGLAVVRGPRDPAITGAIASAAPDLEHLFRFLRPGGRKLFHYGWHNPGGLPTWLQLLAAGALVGYLLRPGGIRK